MFLNKLHLGFRIIRSAFWVGQFNFTSSSYHRMGKELTDKLVSKINLNNAHQFPANGKLKMQWYMADSIFGCEQYGRLIGKEKIEQGRKMYLLSGALLTMCDMIIDDLEMDMDRVKTLKRLESDFAPKDEIEKLYQICYDEFFASLNGNIKETARDYYEKVFDAQVLSKKQFDPEITQQEVDAICKAKCGYCSLLLRTLLNKPFDQTEESFWFELGGFIQYCNDAQDLHKDLHSSIRTFASVRPDLETVKADLEKQWQVTLRQIKSTPFTENKKDDFVLLLYVMYLAIQAKLFQFSMACNFNFSFSQFKLIDKNKIRAVTSPFQLARFVLPRAFQYNYRLI